MIYWLSKLYMIPEPPQATTLHNQIRKKAKKKKKSERAQDDPPSSIREGGFRPGWPYKTCLGPLLTATHLILFCRFSKSGPQCCFGSANAGENVCSVIMKDSPFQPHS